MTTTDWTNFEQLKKRFEERQKQWNSLTPEQQEAERNKFAVYDTRIMAEDYHDEENESLE
ncbi:MAG: hypothetical protein LBJ63_07880 [Prevotellaceae bacterium]|jgi:ribosomal protein S17E|nr:hypothetical protein [Prevotellaceae bacterium]